MKHGKGTPLKILVIEDDPDILNALNIALGSMGFEVHVLLNGQCVLDNKFVLPDLFILDKRLPDVDGLQICQFLKGHPSYSKVPVIVISASRRIRKKALESGAAVFVEKPFQMQELVAAIKRSLHVESF